MPHSTSRSRTRRVGALGLTLTALLSPAGKIIATAIAATALVGSVATHSKNKPSATPTIQVALDPSFTPPHLKRAETAAPILTHIESDGYSIPVMLAEGLSTSHGSPGTPYLSAMPFEGLPNGGMGRPKANSPLPGPVKTGPTGASPAPPSLPATGDAPLQNGPERIPLPTPPVTSKPDTPPAESHAPPTHLAGTGKPADTDAPGEAGAPASPQGGPQDEDNKPGPDQISGPAPIPNVLPIPDMDAPFIPLFQPVGQDIPPHSIQAPLPEKIVQPSPAAIPEPSMMGLMLLGLAAMAWMGRRRPAPERQA